MDLENKLLSDPYLTFATVVAKTEEVCSPVLDDNDCFALLNIIKVIISAH